MADLYFVVQVKAEDVTAVPSNELNAAVWATEVADLVANRTSPRAGRSGVTIVDAFTDDAATSISEA